MPEREKPCPRTFVEMDSHEEKVYNAVRQTQERDAKIKMREKAKVPPACS